MRILIVALALVFASNSLAIEPNRMVSVDLRDLVDWTDYKEFPEAHIVLDSLRKETKTYFPAGVSFSQVMGVEFSALPEPVAHADYFDAVQVRLSAFYGTPSTGFKFRKLALVVSHHASRVLSAEVLEDIPLAAAHFTARASLVERKVIVEDAALGIRKIYPIGVGGFDQGVTAGSRGRTRLVTPTFQGASLDRDTVIPSRSDPSYYKGKPFVRIKRHDGEWTPYAFHITQGETDVTKDGKRVERMRGFYSHGCMRLRDKDLDELFKIVYYGIGHVPVDVALNLNEPSDHPYHSTRTQYRAVVNHCTKEAPCVGKDKDGLTDMAMVRGLPPTEKLGALTGEDAIDALDGDSMSIDEMQEQMQDFGLPTKPAAPVTPGAPAPQPARR